MREGEREGEMVDCGGGFGEAVRSVAQPQRLPERHGLRRTHFSQLRRRAGGGGAGSAAGWYETFKKIWPVGTKRMTWPA